MPRFSSPSGWFQPCLFLLKLLKNYGRTWSSEKWSQAERDLISRLLKTWLQTHSFQRQTTSILPGEQLHWVLHQMLQELLQQDSFAFALSFAQSIVKAYPEDFGEVHCAICSQAQWQLAFTGSKLLPASLNPGAPEFPRYAKHLFPLIYQECLHCGAARINPAPRQHRIDHPLPVQDPQAGQAIWMEEASYIADKEHSLSIHYQQMKLAQFQSAPGASVFDLSCGSGVGLAWLRDQAGWRKLKGLEYDPQAVREAREKRGLDVTCGLIYNAELTGPFDLVILDNALEHHWEPHQALQRLHHLMRPGGGLFIIVPNYHGYSVETLGMAYDNLNWGHWHYFTVQSLQRLLQATGFRLERAYSSVCAEATQAKLGSRPADVAKDLSGPILATLEPHPKIFRGDFIQLLAIRE